jgi:peroxiredoxin
MKKIFTIFILALIAPIFSFADNSMVGATAPSFKIQSGDNQQLSFDDIKGKLIILFYETKETKEKNRKLKDELNEFYNNQPQTIKNEIIRLAVINCKGVLFAGAWRGALRENSKKEGITIYGDWNGKMGLDYNAKNNESNIIVIDKKGIIRYYYSGQLEDKTIPEIKSLLKELQ